MWTPYATAAVVALAATASPQGGTIYARQVVLPSDPDVPMGDSLAMHERTAVSGPYVLVRNGDEWGEQALLMGSDVSAGDEFGSAVDVDGDTIVIGAYRHDLAGNNEAGAAYVFVRSGTTWSEQAKLAADVPEISDHFGRAVSVHADTIAVGAYEVGSGRGSAFVFVRTAATWSQQAKLVPSDGTPGDQFGSSASVAGDRVILGARSQDMGASHQTGAAYIFVREGTQWSEEATLVPPDVALGDRFGWAADLQDDRAVVSSFGDNTINGADGGSVYVFVRSGTAWSFSRKIVPSQALNYGHHFGTSLSIWCDTIVASTSSASFVYSDTSTGWAERGRLFTTPPQAVMAVAMWGEHFLVGAHGGAFFQEGSVHAFQLQDLIAPAFCDASDGALAWCPCSNPGAPDTGCDLAQGTGGVGLDVLRQDYLPEHRATLAGHGFPPAGAPAAVVVRSGFQMTFPVPFGDGLRCVANPLVRLGATLASGGGSLHVIGHGASEGTFFYQVWFRNQPATFCSPFAFNLSNGRALTW